MDSERINNCKEAIMSDSVIADIIAKKMEVMKRSKTWFTLSLSGEFITSDYDNQTKLSLMHLDMDMTNRIQQIKEAYGLHD